MIDEIFENAKKFRALTPYSFKLIFEEMEIFKPKCKKHRENFDFYKPEYFLCLPIMPSEIFCITYNNIVKCPDKNCLNFIDLKELEGDKENENNKEFELDYRANYNMTINNDKKDFFKDNYSNDEENFGRKSHAVTNHKKNFFSIDDNNQQENIRVSFPNNFQTFAHMESEESENIKYNSKIKKNLIIF